MTGTTKKEKASIGAAIRERRKALAMSMDDLARAIGASRSFICLLENGKSGITVAKAKRLSDVIGIPFAELLSSAGQSTEDEDKWINYLYDRYDLDDEDCRLLKRFVRESGIEPDSSGEDDDTFRNRWDAFYKTAQAFLPDPTSRLFDDAEVRSLLKELGAPEARDWASVRRAVEIVIAERCGDGEGYKNGEEWRQHVTERLSILPLDVDGKSDFNGLVREREELRIPSIMGGLAMVTSSDSILSAVYKSKADGKRVYVLVADSAKMGRGHGDFPFWHEAARVLVDPKLKGGTGANIHRDGTEAPPLERFLSRIAVWFAFSFEGARRAAESSSTKMLTASRIAEFKDAVYPGATLRMAGVFIAECFDSPVVYLEAGKRLKNRELAMRKMRPSDYEMFAKDPNARLRVGFKFRNAAADIYGVNIRVGMRIGDKSPITDSFAKGGSSHGEDALSSWPYALSGTLTTSAYKAENDYCVRAFLYKNESPTYLLAPESEYRRISETYFEVLRRLCPKDEMTSDKCYGRFFTAPAMVEVMIDASIAKMMSVKRKNTISIIDPFAGDGRLVVALLKRMKSENLLPRRSISVTLLDVDVSELSEAERTIKELFANSRMEISVEIVACDSFLDARDHQFDICITNPPWCILKPAQGLGGGIFSKDDRRMYDEALKAYQGMLREMFPSATTGNGFSRNCVNLSRCGLAKAESFVKAGGLLAAVMPATLFSDQVSGEMRKDLFEKWTIRNIAYYPAECKLFGLVDQTSVTFVAVKVPAEKQDLTIRRFDKSMSATDIECSDEEIRFIEKRDYVVPFSYNKRQWSVLEKVQQFTKFSQLEDVEFARELDETRIDEKLADTGRVRFIKGFMVDRFSCEPNTARYLIESGERLPPSVWQPKIVWRDVSRESQSRRLKATLIPSGYIAGNSLGVLLSKTSDLNELRYLLAVINSFVFEFQARLHLVSNHVPAGVIKNLCVPENCSKELKNEISRAVAKVIGTHEFVDEAMIECLVGKAYGLDIEEFKDVVDLFKLQDGERLTVDNCAANVFRKGVAR